MEEAIRRVDIMEKHITDYKELYATFMRIKNNKTQQEYSVSAEGKDKVKKGGQKNASR